MADFLATRKLSVSPGVILLDAKMLQAGRTAFMQGKLEEALRAFTMALEEEDEAKEVWQQVK